MTTPNYLSVQDICYGQKPKYQTFVNKVLKLKVDECLKVLMREGTQGLGDGKNLQDIVDKLRRRNPGRRWEVQDLENGSMLTVTRYT